MKELIDLNSNVQNVKSIRDVSRFRNILDFRKGKSATDIF